MEGKTELQRNAVTEARRNELDSFQRALDIEGLNNRMDDGRMGRCIAQIQREAELEKDFQERTDHAAIVNARAEKETKFALEVAKVRREEMCQLLRRHYLRQRDPSLRELVKKLEAGYVCRDLKQQILHNEYKKLQEKAEDNRANAVLQKALYSDSEALEQEEQDKMDRNAQYGKELQQQLVRRQQQRQCAYEDTLIENQMIQEVNRTMADEDQREYQKKRVETERLHQEMITSELARMAWKDKQKAMIVNEESQIEHQRLFDPDRSSAVIAEREHNIQMKDEHNQRIGAKTFSDEEARHERENVIELLHEQEYLEKNAQDDQAVKEKEIAVKKEMMEALTNQMASNKRDVLKQKEVDAGFWRQTEAILAVEDQREREKAIRHKEKERQYSQDLLQQIEDNKRRRELQNSQNKQEDARAQRVWESDWRSEVAKERNEIVSEHAPQVLGSIQAGTLQPSDLQALEEGGRKSPELEEPDITHLSPVKRHPKCNAQCRALKEC